jgi:hypothetical protein
MNIFTPIVFVFYLQLSNTELPIPITDNSLRSAQSSRENPNCDLFFETCNQVCDETICTSSNAYICSQEILLCEIARDQSCGFFTTFNCVPRVPLPIYVEVSLFCSFGLLLIFILKSNRFKIYKSTE